MVTEEHSQEHEKTWQSLQNADDVVKRNVAVVKRVINEVWNASQFDAYGEVFSENYLGHFPNGIEHRGVEELKDFMNAARLAFLDMNLTIEDIVAMGDKTTIRWTLRAPHQGEFMGIPAS